MTSVQSHLTRHVAKTALSETQVAALGARAWEDQETLVVRLSQVTDPIIRKMVVAIADHLFARRS